MYPPAGVVDQFSHSFSFPHPLIILIVMPPEPRIMLVLRLVIVGDSGERYFWGLVTGERDTIGRGNLRKSTTDISLSGRIHAQISWGTLGNLLPSTMSDVGGKLVKKFDAAESSLNVIYFK